MTMPRPILLYDGVCGLCNRLVQFVLKRDRDEVFRFASLQSPAAGRILSRHGASSSDLDTLYIVVNPEQPGEHLLPRSDAVIFILKHLEGPWRQTALALQLVPRSLRDLVYLIVARHRYRIFGRYETCPIPAPETRARFLNE